MRDKVIYISGKYSGDIADNILKARNASIGVWELGFTALCPHLNTQHFETDCKCTYDDYINGDIELIKRCDGVLMLDGWRDSYGAKIEKEWAEKLGKPIFYTLKHIKEYYYDRIGTLSNC